MFSTSPVRVIPDAGSQGRILPRHFTLRRRLRMFRRKPAPDLIRGGYRFADKNMRQSMILARLRLRPTSRVVYSGIAEGLARSFDDRSTTVKHRLGLPSLF